jgi:hypothetical protein
VKVQHFSVALQGVHSPFSSELRPEGVSIVTRANFPIGRRESTQGCYLAILKTILVPIFDSVKKATFVGCFEAKAPKIHGVMV